MTLQSRPADFRIFADAKVQKPWELHKLLLQKRWYAVGGVVGMNGDYDFCYSFFGKIAWNENECLLDEILEKKMII